MNLPATAGPATGPWLARLPAVEAGAVAALRLVPGLECRADGAWWWLRGPRWDDDLERLARAVPGLEHCQGAPGSPAVPHGRLLPVATVPTEGWQALRVATSPAAPPVGFPGRVATRLPLTLVRGAAEHPADLLACSWADFARWADDAPEHRLAVLRFAVDHERGQVLVRGAGPGPAALPALPGARHWLCGPLALPAGWTCSPALGADAATALCGVAPGDVLLAVAGPHDSAPRWELVPASAWMAATRSAVRLSGAGSIGFDDA